MQIKMREKQASINKTCNRDKRALVWKLGKLLVRPVSGKQLKAAVTKGLMCLRLSKLRTRRLLNHESTHEEYLFLEENLFLFKSEPVYSNWRIVCSHYKSSRVILNFITPRNNQNSTVILREKSHQLHVLTIHSK